MIIKDLSIIIVTFNSQEYISEGIEHIEAAKTPPDTRKIVVNNDSRNITLKIIRNQFFYWLKLNVFTSMKNESRYVF